MKRTLTVLTAAGLAAAVSTATAGAAMAAPSERTAHTTSISASQAYAAAAGGGASTNGPAEPAAVPLVVFTAFAVPAAGAVGQKVGGWAADKIIGTWAEPTSTSDALIFD